MGAVAISICIGLYLVTGAGCLLRKDYPHAIMWGSYALANVGLLLHELQSK